MTWKMDGTVVAQRANTSAYTSGNIMLGYMDIFASVASPLADAFILFSNVRVEDWTSAPIAAPTVSVTPTNAVASTGNNISFNAVASGGGQMSYQWLFNGTNIAGATSSNFTVTAAQLTNAGSYSVIVSNLAGSVVSTAAANLLVQPFSINPIVTTNGQVQLSFSGALGSHYIIQTSSNLVVWLPLTTLTNSANPVIFVDTNSTAASARFYRVVTAP